MQILMVTNTYKPYTGGVQRSIESFTERFRRLGHEVLIIAPKAEAAVEDEQENVFRVSCIKNFNDTNFPVTIPLPGELSKCIEKFKPDIVHSHFPFIVGNAAMRIAASYNIPLVFTYHTMYDQYTHYINSNSHNIRSFVKTLTTGYANLCDAVIAPSEAVKKDLILRDVKTNIEVIPTGVDFEMFSQAEGEDFRKKYKINPESFVVGHTGRLAKEKNLIFLSDAVSKFLQENTNSYFLVVGGGAQKADMQVFFKKQNLEDSVIFTGMLSGKDLADAYNAMDIFVFSSKSETQGMVLAEAMVAGLPIVALKARGVNEILKNNVNGFKVDEEDAKLFAEKISQCKRLSGEQFLKLKQNAKDTSKLYSIEISAAKAIALYEKLIKTKKTSNPANKTEVSNILNIVKAEWDIFTNYLKAVREMISESQKYEK